MGQGNQLEKAVTFQTTDVPLVTTAETVIVVSPAVRVPAQTVRVVIKAWCQLLVGTTTSALTIRLRRGPTLTDPIIGEVQGQQLQGAAGQTEPVIAFATEQLQDLDQVQYSLTVQQTAATANGTALQAMIEVDLLVSS